eukprot:6312512-Pyramimonas_sp.AAC.1
MVRGPAAAAILTVHELGWHMKDAWTILDGAHCKWDIREAAPPSKSCGRQRGRSQRRSSWIGRSRMRNASRSDPLPSSCQSSSSCVPSPRGFGQGTTSTVPGRSR